MLALTFKKPVIAPRCGIIPEIISEKQGNLFSTYEEMTNIMDNYIFKFINNKWDHNLFNFDLIEQNYSWDKIIDNEPFLTLFKRI